MTRAYIRLDPAFDERKESYPDGPYAALIATLCLAEHQPDRGRFRSLDYLARLLGRRGRHVRYLLAHNDVTELPDGRIYVQGWDEWQEGDWKVSERVHRIRARRGVTVPVTVGVTVGVTPDRLDSGAERSGAMSANGADPSDDGRADLEAFLLINRRAPTPKQRQLLDSVLQLHDVTGPQWAADIMLAHPDDPIGAVIAADKVWRSERIAAARAQEKKPPQPRRRGSGMTGINAEIAKAMRELEAKRGAA